MQKVDNPYFLISIDTEGDNAWSQPTTNNADFLPRFQSLFEDYGLQPTYVTNFEMANSSSFRKFGRDIIQRKVGKIGMHIHAYSPPIKTLTVDDTHHQPYLIEYPADVKREKISTSISAYFFPRCRTSLSERP